MEEASSEEEDNISKLPDFLIHHILSFVNMKQAVRTCILSKRWARVWTSLPFLNFDQEDDGCGYYYRGRGYRNYVDFVDNVLTFRDGESFDISRFHILRLYGEYESFFMRTLGRWIVVVARSNVEDMNVQFTGDHTSDDEEDFEVPGCVSTSKSLTKLELDLHKHKIIMSNSVSLPRLKYLRLTNTSFNDAEELTRLCSSCPVLEHLDLSGVRSAGPLNITVSSLTLKHLELRIGYSCRNTLKLYAPNLVHLVLSNLDYMLLESLPALVTADVGVPLRPRKLNAHQSSPMVQAPDTLQSLEPLNNVQNLTISFRPLKDDSNGRELYEIESDEGSESESEQDWHTSEIMGLEGSGIELKFIEILMKNAVVLKKLVLEKDRYRSRNEDFIKFGEELENFPSISTSLRLYLRIL
ncbi:hypothetical protein MKW94_013556 [Papaver nudicaule]|uniref:F-box domain-containing protein n=1 Tax=Papaver nudicaule TaxID=74823 RepID=A0AA41VTS1_PAPNU|nr:hypothetical protein [Papaver nudicaule]